MDYLDAWYHNLESRARTSKAWQENVSVTGVCHKHLGPRVDFASVALDFLPSKEFAVEDQLNPEILHFIRERDWYEHIIFGVLDVMLTVPRSPIGNFKILIRHVEYNEIESNPTAFRLAARDAASKAIEVHYPK